MFQLLNCVACSSFEDLRFQILPEKSQAERSGDLAGHVMSPYLEIKWLGTKYITAAVESRAVWIVAPACWKKGSSVTVWRASSGIKKVVLQHVNVTWSSHSYSLSSLIFKEVRTDNSKWRYRARYCDFGTVKWFLIKFFGACGRPKTENLFVNEPG